MKRLVLASAALVCLAGSVARGEILLEEDFEDDKLPERGFKDINWGKGKSKLSVVGEPDVKPLSGKGCLKINYPKGSAGGWMYHKLAGVDEFYCRYYRYFPEGFA